MRAEILDTIIAVDTNIKLFNEHTAAWAMHGISTTRAVSMQDAIDRLVTGERFFFVAVNGDSIPDYLEHLPLMRAITALPIFVFSSCFTVEKNILAREGGADMLDLFATSPKEHVIDVLQQLKTQRRWSEQPISPLPLLLGPKIILSPLRRAVYVNYSRVELGTKEFDILKYLMENKARVVEYPELIMAVWRDEHDPDDHNFLWVMMRRLRKRLKEAAPDINYIVSVRNVGYKFTD